MDIFRRFFSLGDNQLRPQLILQHTNSLPQTSPVPAQIQEHEQAQPSVHFAPETQFPPRRRRSHHRKTVQPPQRSSNMLSVKMSGPDCKDIVEFKKSIAGIPSNVKAPFEAISKDTLEKVTDTCPLTVWETDADIDGLLQLTEVFFKIKAANMTSDEKVGSGWGGTSSSKKAMGMVIISQEKHGRDAHRRVVDLLRHLTETRGEEHLNGSVHAFESVVIVRGINYSKSSSKEEDKEVLKRINTSIERVLKMTHRSSSSSKPKMIWHHGPVVSLLLMWINNTKDELRSALSAITITAAVTFADGIKPSTYGAANKPKDLQTLEKYATRLNVPVLFLDPVTQLIHNEYLSHFIYYFGYYITLFLPPSVTKSHYYKALDHLTTFAFQLWGATKNVYDEEVVAQVKQHLNGERSQRWASKCIDASSFSRAACLEAGQEIALQHAASLADAPWAMYTTSPTCPLPSLTRLAICPISSSTSLTSTYTAAPVSFNYTTSTYRVSNPSPFRILVPRDGIDVTKMEQRIQGTMTAVLTRVMEVKRQKPPVGEREALLWEDTLGAFAWALNSCMAGLPEEIRRKVEVVGRMLVVVGCWGAVVKGREKSGRAAKKVEGGWNLPM